MKKTEIIKASDYGLEETKAKEMVKGLNVTIEERKILEDAYIDVIELEINEENLPTFKDLRLRIVKNRTQGIEKWHKTNKAFYLAGGRFVDAIKNKEILVNEQMESKLMDAEKHFENLELQRVKDLQLKRVNDISKYLEDAELRNFSEMEEDVWKAYFETKKKEYNDRIEAEKQAELKRVEEEKAEDERRKAIEVENKRLKAEAEAKELRLEKERKNREKLAKIETEKRAKEQKIRQAKIDKERKEYEAKLKNELEAKAKIEAELKAKNDAEIKVKEDEEKRIQLELNKGDSAKVIDLIEDLELLKDKYSFKSTKNKKMYNDVQLLIDKVINYIK